MGLQATPECRIKPGWHLARRADQRHQDGGDLLIFEAKRLESLGQFVASAVVHRQPAFANVSAYAVDVQLLGVAVEQIPQTLLRPRVLADKLRKLFRSIQIRRLIFGADE